MIELTVPRNIPTSFDGIVDISQLKNKTVDQVEEQTNLKLNKAFSGLSGWVRLRHSVDWHTDDTGMCFIYVAHGVGILRQDVDGKETFAHLSPGCYTTFDDRLLHSFDCITKNVTFLVMTVKGTMYPHIKKSSYHRSLR